MGGGGTFAIIMIIAAEAPCASLISRLSDHVYNNLIFNSCRESADHGPINSCACITKRVHSHHPFSLAPALYISGDRQPYVSDVATGKPSAKMLTRNISFNFLVGNYGGGNGAIE